MQHGMAAAVRAIGLEDPGNRIESAIGGDAWGGSRPAEAVCALRHWIGHEQPSRELEGLQFVSCADVIKRVTEISRGAEGTADAVKRLNDLRVVHRVELTHVIAIDQVDDAVF